LQRLTSIVNNLKGENLPKAVKNMLVRGYRVPVSSLLHRPGNARRGFKVGFRFRLQDRFTTASRQFPHVERESDQST